MPITAPTGSTPANYTDSSITRFGLISALNVINVGALQDYHETYGYVPYNSINQFMGNEEKSDNKQFNWYQSRGRAQGFVTASANVSVAANASATITVAAGNYSALGTKSLPALGLILYNSRTGVEGRVSAVPNKSTANAHTFVLTPVKLAQNVSVLAGDELLSRGFKYLGEQSDKTETVIRTIDKYSNFCTQIRADSTIGDLAAAETMEIMINGSKAYINKQMKDDNLRLMQELDYLLFEGGRVDNLPYAEEGTNGIIKQVEGNGLSGTYTNWSLATFAEIERVLNSVGAPKEYDILSDNASYIEMQNSIFTEINNGAAVYADTSKTKGAAEIDRNFKSLNIYNRLYNFTNFGLFDENRVYGSTGLGLRNRFSLFLPQGKETTYNSNQSSSVKVPRLTTMYQTPFGGNKWHTKENGLFSDGGGTKAERIITTIGYFGARMVGAQQSLIMKGSV